VALALANLMINSMVSMQPTFEPIARTRWQAGLQS